MKAASEFHCLDPGLSRRSLSSISQRSGSRMRCMSSPDEQHHDGHRVASSSSHRPGCGSSILHEGCLSSAQHPGGLHTNRAGLGVSVLHLDAEDAKVKVKTYRLLSDKTVAGLRSHWLGSNGLHADRLLGWGRHGDLKWLKL